MPPYQNDSLHDMHALMQQLDTLNAGHAPEHLEMFEGLINKIKSTERGKKMVDGVTKLMGKDVDAEANWERFTDTQKITVFKNTFLDIIYDIETNQGNGKMAWTQKELDTLKNAMHGITKIKLLLQANMTSDPKPRTVAVPLGNRTGA